MGLTWSISADSFLVRLRGIEDKCASFTKKDIVSYTASNSDPLGYIAPVILPIKHFVQTLCQKGYERNQLLNAEDVVTWKRLISTLGNTSDELRITRRVEIFKNGTTVQLHIFCDASQIAYAAVAYLKFSDSSNVKIIFAKSRLSLSKGLTIPRLELLGVLIGYRMSVFMQREIDSQIERTYPIYGRTRNEIGRANV